MKKVLCIVLSVIMIFSSFSVFSVSAANNIVNPLHTYYSYEELIDYQGDVEVYGYSVDYLYNQTLYVDWSELSIMYDGENMTKNQLALVKSDINSYTRRILYNMYGGNKFYTDENATKLSNFIGKILNPNFIDVYVDFGSTVTPNEDDFYEAVAVNSGLADLIQNTWCSNLSINFDEFLTAFGVNLGGIFDYERSNGTYLATELLKAAASDILNNGLIDYIIGLLRSFSFGYTSTLRDATKALLTKKLNGADFEYTEEFINSVEGLLTICFYNITDYEFIKFPTRRIVNSTDSVESILFIMMYFAINNKYKGNEAVVNGLAYKLNSVNFAAGGYNSSEIKEIKKNLGLMIDWVLKGNVTDEALALMTSLTNSNMSELPNDLLSKIRNSFASIIRKIADYFDYLFKLFSGEIQFGDPI